MGWVVNATPRLYPWEWDWVPIAREAGWAPGRIWMCAQDLAPTGVQSLDHPACSESLLTTLTSLQHGKYEIKIYSCNLERIGCGDLGHTQKSSAVILECLNNCGYHMYLQDYGVNFSMSGDVSFLGLWHKRVKLCFYVLVCMLDTHTHTHTHVVWFHNVTWVQFGFVCCICLVLWQRDFKTGFKPWHRDELS
jgi:hypothetical protein